VFNRPEDKTLVHQPLERFLGVHNATVIKNWYKFSKVSAPFLGVHNATVRDNWYKISKVSAPAFVLLHKITK
jgi:hypothetical protein